MQAVVEALVFLSLLIFATWCTTKVVLEFVLVPEMSDEEWEIERAKTGKTHA
jgi:Na+-transporting methylmalonyl-CoA/oxaloacetate decarboxylase gamma subunit